MGNTMPTSHGPERRSMGNVFYLRLFHEMNGNWYPWGLNVNGNTPALAIQALATCIQHFPKRRGNKREIHVVPECARSHLVYPIPLASFYPGDAYVSWLGLDGYIGAFMENRTGGPVAHVHAGISADL